MKTTFLFLTTLFLLFTVFLPNISLADYTEWSLPEGAITRLGKGTIKDLKLSPDGTLLAVASSIGVWLYDVHTGEELVLLTGHTASVTSVAFSSDGSTLASGSMDSTIRLWEVSTGRTLKTLKGHKLAVASVCFSPDDKILASASRNGTIRLWRVGYGVHLKTLTEEKKYYGSLSQSVVFSGNGKIIATPGEKDIYLWDVSSGKQRKLPTEHTEFVKDIAFSDDGKTLASVSGDEIYLWDVLSGKQRKPRIDHTKPVSSIAFSGDGNLLAYASGNEIYLWNTVSHTQRKISATHTDSIISLDFSDNGKTLVSASEVEVCFSDAISRKHLKNLIGHTRSVSSVAFNKDKDSNMLAYASGKEIYLWDVVSAEKRDALRHTEIVNDIAFSSEETLASASGKEIYLWDAISGEHKETLTGHRERVTSVVFRRDGRTLASASGKEIYLWDAISGEHKETLTGHTESVDDIAFSGSGKTLASASGKEIYLWDAISGEHKETLTAYETIYDIDSSNNWQEFFAAADVYGKINIWHAFLGPYQKRTFTTENTGMRISPIRIAFNHDDKILASTDLRKISLWAVVSGTQRKTFKGHTNQVNSIAFSADYYNTLASASRDGTVLLWNGDIPLIGIGIRPQLRKEDIAKKAMDSTVVIIANVVTPEGEIKSRLGSGFVIDSIDSMIATNYHVAKDSDNDFVINRYVKLVNRSEVYNIEEIVAVDRENDLAILKIKGPIPALRLRLGNSNKVEFYAPVCAVGNPRGAEGTPSWGNVTNTEAGNSKKLFQIDAAVSKGSSGGPLLNDRGEVVGIIVGGLDEGLDLNFAIPSNYLQELIDKMKQPK